MRIIDKGKPEKARRTFVSRIVVSIAATILLTCSAISGLSIYQAYPSLRDAHFDRARANMVLAFKAAVDSKTYPTLPQLVEYGDHLVEVTTITGGAYFDSVGEYRGRFGHKPLLTWQKAKLDQIERAFVDDNKQMEIFIDPSEIGIDYGIALRFEIKDIWKAIDAELARKITTVLAVTLATTVSLTLLITVIVLVPVNRMRSAVAHTLDDPKDAQSFSLRMRRRDELGQLGRGIDQLFYVLSHTFEEDLGNALAIQAHIPNPLVIYGADGEVEDANPAALAFFDVTNPTEIEPVAHQEVRIDGSDLTLREFLERGQGLEYGDFHSGDDWVPCRIGGGIIRRQNGAVRRYFAILTDLTFAQTQMTELKIERDTAQENAGVWASRNRELRDLLDACMAIVENGKVPDTGKQRPSTLPERVINTWYRDAIRTGRMEPRSLRHSVLPPIGVDHGPAKRIFNHVLSAVHARSERDHPKILVTAREKPNGTVEFTIGEVLHDASSEAPMSKTGKTGASIYMAAFTNLLDGIGGRLVRLTGSRGENTLVFRLPASRVRWPSNAEAVSEDDSEAA
ncbi:MAG: PAS domain-containing protein [Rhodobiaceae bacterium]|nr:PAS domain-containing protein [Rhodobiaceae bacterium]